MIIRRGEERSLLTWLTTQERVLALWIEEVLCAAPKNVDFISKLEVHHAWLLDQIEYLTKSKVV